MSHQHENKPDTGFTLIELLIVVAIIAIIAAVAIPNLISSRLTANESSAISTLRLIVSAQSQAQSRGAVDSDVDGQGESLYLGELSGTVNLRGLGAPLDPAIVSVSLGQVANSAVNKSGYFFSLFLPDPAGAGVPEDPNGGKGAPGAIGADLAEVFWVCYAWPAANGSSGRRAFAVNQSGDILQTDNSVQAYAGTGTPPAADGAYSSAGDLTVPFSVAGVPAPAQDGGTWITVN